MSGFNPVFKPTEHRPKSIYLKSKARKDIILQMLKDELKFESLLALGAVLISIVYLLIGRIAFILAPSMLAIRFLDSLLQLYGYRKNPLMDNVLLEPLKYSAQYPESDGTFSGKPADGQIAVFMIGARVNHPFGLLAPGAEELGSFFQKMVKEVEQNAEEYGYLGSSGWTAEQRPTGNETNTIMYFKSAEGIHKYAHGDLHKQGWAWWNKTAAQHTHIGIWHEIFVAPKGQWETIYLNSEPLGLGAAQFPIKGKDGKTMWQNPLVDASRGVLRSSRGRMTWADGADNEKYEWDTYKGRV